MDRVGANFQGCLKMMVDRLKTTPLPIQLPLGKEDDFRGVIDLVTMKAIIYDPHSLGTKYEIVDIPEAYLQEASIAREYLIEKLAERNDYLMEKFIDGHEITEEEIRQSLRETTLQLKGIPVLYYISPQIWAWRPGRVKLIAERVKKMVVFFPLRFLSIRPQGWMWSGWVTLWLILSNRPYPRTRLCGDSVSIPKGEPSVSFPGVESMK
jgi:hypothetical protein